MAELLQAVAEVAGHGWLHELRQMHKHSGSLSPLAGAWLRKRTHRTPAARPSTVSRQSQAAAGPATGAAPDRLPPQQAPQLEETLDLLDLSPVPAEQAADQRPALQQSPHKAALQTPQLDSGRAKVHGLADVQLPSLPHSAEQHQAEEGLLQPHSPMQQQQQQVGQSGQGVADQPAAPQQQPGTAADLDSALADSLLQSCSPDEEEQRILAFGTPAFLQQVALSPLFDRQVWFIEGALFSLISDALSCSCAASLASDAPVRHGLRRLSNVAHHSMGNLPCASPHYGAFRSGSGPSTMRQRHPR